MIEAVAVKEKVQCPGMMQSCAEGSGLGALAPKPVGLLAPAAAPVMPDGAVEGTLPPVEEPPLEEPELGDHWSGTVLSVIAANHIPSRAGKLEVEKSSIHSAAEVKFTPSTLNDALPMMLEADGLVVDPEVEEPDGEDREVEEAAVVAVVGAVVAVAAEAESWMLVTQVSAGMACAISPRRVTQSTSPASTPLTVATSAWFCWVSWLRAEAPGMRLL